MSLATKYRPQDFYDLVGQEHVVKILQNQLKTENTKQVYLFCGPAGDGKTTTARILAAELNKGKGGIIEIDAASNNGVDNIRDLIENCKFKPIDTKFKIYIIDECHMLSTGAWNSALKIFEEPPIHAIFILCTTDPQKIPATVLSRVQRFDFRRLRTEEIANRLKNIIEWENEDIVETHCGSQDAVHDIEWAKQEGIPVIECEEETLTYIAKLANGGMRDAISLLDTCVGYSNALAIDDVTKILGTANYYDYFLLFRYIREQDGAAIIKLIDNLYQTGKNLSTFIKGFVDFLVDLRKYQLVGDFDYITIPELYKENLDEIAKINEQDIMVPLQALTTLINRIKYEKNIKPLIEGELLCLI
jgi:DNA polymerase-3 subunit gamma/tau